MKKGTFERSKVARSEVPRELRLAYREATLSVLACYFLDPFLFLSHGIENRDCADPSTMEYLFPGHKGSHLFV
nr:probable inactive ATP-dependent zinc metalloprotease FTSHI 4, chloroplastic [Tanacetum cinerariifolium]GEW40813.1 probable inactive ATP-dependent zinc metalloprotease FTSHI 4, chloroplastic [Tanacetum cinerariifolium]